MAGKKTSPRKLRQASHRRVEIILQPAITGELQRLYNAWRNLESEQDGKAVRQFRRGRKAENEARLAFKKRLGPCVQCKKRKNLCNHWSLAELEDAFRQRDARDPMVTPDETEDEVTLEKGQSVSESCECKKGPESPVLALPPSPSPSPTLPPKMEGLPTTPTMPRVTTKAENLEVKTEDQRIKMEDSFEHSPPKGQEQESKSPTNDTALDAPFEYKPYKPFEYTFSPNYRHIPMPATFVQPCAFQIGIGRQTAPSNPPWECVFAAGEPPTFCGDKFHNEFDLFAHFSSQHHPIKTEGQMTFWVCRRCQMWNDVHNYCLQCGWADVGVMEYWLCGFPVEEGIESLSSSTVTEGRDMVKTDDGDGGSGGQNAVTESMSDLFTRPQGISEEEFRRRIMAVEANSEMPPGSTNLFSPPRQGMTEPFAATDFSASPNGKWWLSGGFWNDGQ